MPNTWISPFNFTVNSTYCNNSWTPAVSEIRCFLDENYFPPYTRMAYLATVYDRSNATFDNRCCSQVVAREQTLNDPTRRRKVRQYLAGDCSHARTGTERRSRILYRCSSRIVAAPYCGLKLKVAAVSDQSYMVTRRQDTSRTLYVYGNHVIKSHYRITSKNSASLIFRHPSLKLDKYFLIFGEGNPKQFKRIFGTSRLHVYIFVCRDGYCSKP